MIDIFKKSVCAHKRSHLGWRQDLPRILVVVRRLHDEHAWLLRGLEPDCVSMHRRRRGNLFVFARQIFFCSSHRRRRPQGRRIEKEGGGGGSNTSTLAGSCQITHTTTTTYMPTCIQISIYIQYNTSFRNFCASFEIRSSVKKGSWSQLESFFLW